jgi:hypothetical protein
MEKYSSNAIKKLLEQYVAVCESAENQRNATYWSNAGDPWLIERWRGISAKKTGAPFTMAMDIAGYATILSIDCGAYYTQAEAQLHEQMRYHLWEAENLICNRFFDKTAFISFGAVYTASILGAKIEYPAGQAPWVNMKQPLLTDRDVSKLKDFDLRTGGLAPRAHEFYERMCELTEGSGIKVMYPTTIRGPFSVATQLRETTALLMDMLDAPQFVHDLMRAITDAIKKHATLRSEYTGEPIAPAKLFNDEIATPMISPAMYEEFILPYELELAEFHSRVHYWHSCGVTNGFYKAVSTIPNLEMMHIGPWSNVALAAEVFSKTNVALDICLNATGDVYDQTDEGMRATLQSIKDACEGRVKYAVRADGFQIVRGVEEDLSRIRRWNAAAADVFASVTLHP